MIEGVRFLVVALLTACGHSAFGPADASTDADVQVSTPECTSFGGAVACPDDASSDATCATTSLWSKFGSEDAAAVGCQIWTSTVGSDGGCANEETTCTLVDGGTAWVTVIE